MLRNKIIYFGIFWTLAIYTCFSFIIETDRDLNQDKINTYDTIVPFKIEIAISAKSPENELKGIIMDQLIKKSGDSIKLKDIKSVKYIGSYNFNDINQALVFKIKLSYDLPAVWHYSIALVVDNINHNAYLVDLDLIEPIKIRQDSDLFYFAGRYKDRYSYGIFKIFKFKNGIMYDIFESNEAVSNLSDDCISYEKDDLKLQNTDLNNDGYLDLKFTGIKNYYCNGYEQYGRKERKPVKSEKIAITYYFDKNNLNWKK